MSKPLDIDRKDKSSLGQCNLWESKVDFGPVEHHENSTSWNNTVQIEIIKDIENRMIWPQSIYKVGKYPFMNISVLFL